MVRFLWIFLALSGGPILLDAESAPQRLQDVKTIYVAPLRGENAVSATVITERLISYVAKRHAVSIIDNEENADAILQVALTVQTVPDEFGRPVYRVHGTAHLNNKDGVVLWADDASNSRFAKSATSSFADNLAKKLSQAIVGSGERRQ